MNDKLNPCVFCGEDKQLQVIKVDAKNPGRDLVKCRHCRGEAPRKYWNETKSRFSKKDIFIAIREVMTEEINKIEEENK